MQDFQNHPAWVVMRTLSPAGSISAQALVSEVLIWTVCVVWVTTTDFNSAAEDWSSVTSLFFRTEISPWMMIVSIFSKATLVIWEGCTLGSLTIIASIRLFLPSHHSQQPVFSCSVYSFLADRTGLGLRSLFCSSLDQTEHLNNYWMYFMKFRTGIHALHRRNCNICS